MKKPNRVFAPVIIAGITVGFLASAYKFIFAKSDTTRAKPDAPTQPASSSEAKKTSEHA